LRKRKDAVYLDVRSVAEFEAGHPQGAYNIPVMFFDAARRPVPNTDFAAVVAATFGAEVTLLVGCQSGVRSQHAAELLAAHGYLDVANVIGGFGGSPMARGWRDSGLPVETGSPQGRSYAELAKSL
jgi:rhodanese-related sulfurtransferase